MIENTPCNYFKNPTGLTLCPFCMRKLKTKDRLSNLLNVMNLSRANILSEVSDSKLPLSYECQ